MIAIDNVLISDDVIEAKFVCDLHKCKGGCCEDGDAGAPLEKEEKKMLETSRYFDAMNFATRAKCPGLIGLGLVDPVCPAEGVLATCNQLQGPKEIVIMPLADHGGDHKAFYEKFGPFLDKQLKD